MSKKVNFAVIDAAALTSLSGFSAGLVRIEKIRADYAARTKAVSSKIEAAIAARDEALAAGQDSEAVTAAHPIDQYYRELTALKDARQKELKPVQAEVQTCITSLVPDGMYAAVLGAVEKAATGKAMTAETVSFLTGLGLESTGESSPSHPVHGEHV